MTPPPSSSTRAPTRKKTSGTETLVLGLGSNVGPREATLRWAIDELGRILRGSLQGPLLEAPLYRSTAVSPIAQPDYLNTVVLGRVRRPAAGLIAPGPEDLLALAKALELAAGRQRGPRFGPRPLDVDLLIFGARRSHRPELTLPHPRLADRRFVLAPLADLCPDLQMPDRNGTVREVLDSLGDGQKVERITWTRGPAGNSRLAV